EEKTLREYLDQIENCNSSRRLKYEYGISDNWPILLFGDRGGLYSKVIGAFENSYQEFGIRAQWNFLDTLEDSSGIESRRQYEYNQGSIVAQVAKGPYPEFMINEVNRIHGEENSVWVMFHPYQENRMDINECRAMASAISGFGEYVLREKLTARFPKAGSGISYIP
ncbi:MAG: hypothetical protein ACQEP1_06680, partial [Nanobdellota archaeon]